MNGFPTKLHLGRALAIAAVCVAVAGCTTDGRGAAADLESSVQPRETKMIALASDARQPANASRPPVAALPAEVGVVGSVRTRDYVDGFRQDIALGGGAIRTIANGITVLARTTRQPTLDEHVPLDKPSEAAIRSEIGAQFPHILMQVVDRESSNSYGPYGLALGRASNDVRCLYMWQWIDDNRLPQSADLTGPASVRVRICRAGMTFDAMAAALDHLAIGRDVAASAPERIAATAQTPVIVTPDADEKIVDQAPKKQAATVRKRRVAKRQRMPKAEVAARDAGDSAADEPRYMSPAPASARARPASAMAASTAALPADLPPQAYLGPRSASQPSPVSSPN